jgi:hypothetical protein
MGADIKKENECFQKDYDKLYAEGNWNKDKLEAMKNYKKLIYYNLAIDAMENGQGFPGSQYLEPPQEMRNMNNSGFGNIPHYPRGGSGMYYDSNPMPNRMMPWDNGNRYHDNMNASGRRYYDDKKKDILHTLHHMMDDTEDHKKKDALKFVIDVLESEQLM